MKIGKQEDGKFVIVTENNNELNQALAFCADFNWKLQEGYKFYKSDGKELRTIHDILETISGGEAILAQEKPSGA